jgi:hypothetical protein
MSYLDDFRKHQISVRAHLKGKQENDPTLPPSFFLPASLWTSSEKDLFFHGLTLYSRFRPDLIADHIKTKSVFDVCVYLHVLRVSTISRGHEPDPSTREIIEPAMEMSERWVEYEEQMAAALTPVDSCCQSLENSKKPTQSNCSCASPKIRITPAEPGLTPSSQKAYMAHLDSTRLAILESIIWESQSDDVDIENTMLLEQAPGISPLAEPHDLESEFQGIICHFCSLMLSFKPSTPPAPNIQPAPLEPSITTLTPLLPLANPGPQESSCNPHEGIVKPTFTNNSHLRRLQKRLYMRRKRAEKVGRSLIPVSIEPLPGRERRSRKPSKSRSKISHSKRTIGLSSGSSKLVFDGIQPPIDPSESLDESWFEPRSRGGPTKPYRVKKTFRENDIDAHTLSEMGLDIFHLPTLARLMRYYSIIISHTSTKDSRVDCSTPLMTQPHPWKQSIFLLRPSVFLRLSQRILFLKLFVGQS